MHILLLMNVVLACMGFAELWWPNPRGNTFKLAKPFIPISLWHILESLGICVWRLMNADVKGKQFYTKTIFNNQCIVTFTFDLLNLTSIGHILNSQEDSVWSVMIIGVKIKQLCDINHFQFSMYYGPLTFWPRNPSICHNIDSCEVFAWRTRQIMKFHDDRCKEKPTMWHIPFSMEKGRYLHKCIVTLTIYLLTPKFIEHMID